METYRFFFVDFFCVALCFRVPEHLDGIPILALESNPEFEADPERAKEMMKEVSSVLKGWFIQS